MLILQAFKQIFSLPVAYPARTRNLHAHYSVIEEIVEDFVESFSPS